MVSIAGNELAATAVRGTEQGLDGLVAGERMVVLATEVVPGESVTVMATEVTTEPSPRDRSRPPSGVRRCAAGCAPWRATACSRTSASAAPLHALRRRAVLLHRTI